MKGRSFSVIFFAIIALLFASLSGYSKTADHVTKPAAKGKTIKSTSPIESQSYSEKRYSVRQGDNLSKIAQRFKTTPQAIQSANGLTSNKLKPGQILSIPVSKTAKSASTKKKNSPRDTHRDPNETYISAAPPQEPPIEGAGSESASTPIRLVQAGFQLIGVKYRFGGSGNSGFDCSGLVKTLFSRFNIDLPRSSREQFQKGQQVSRDELKPGDLVFFSSGGSQPTHVGIYVGNNQMLHAARKAQQVIVTDINQLWNTMRYLGARRVTDLWSDDPPQEEPKE
jgi:cell wall-associated NlpC family hydrolase